MKVKTVRKPARKIITIWSLLILAGVVAYGVGLYQGSQYRMKQRAIASVPVLILDSPNNTQSPKSPTK